jgi:hypothetical protein
VSRLCRIVYCSRSLIVGSRADVEMKIRTILASARTKNRAANVSGAMTFNESFFAQVLEGAVADVAPIFERIRRDPRHCDVKILAQSQAPRRLFPTWSMAYVESDFGDGRHPLAHFSFEAALITGAGHEAKQLLGSLRQLVRANTEAVG